MKITNHLGLPAEIYEYLKIDMYDHAEAAGTLSATTLLKPIQEVILTQRYWDKIEVDALGRLWSLFGSGIHRALESLEDGSATPIKRMRAEIAGEIVSGKQDRIAHNKIKDYKVTSVWTYVYGSREKEWGEQLSIYRWLYYQQTGQLLDEVGYIIAIFRDWSEKSLGGNYPKLPILEIPINLMPLVDTEKFIHKQVSAIKAARSLPDDQLPKCSDSERWFNKKKGVYQKCEKYCPAKAHCVQFKDEDLFG